MHCYTYVLQFLHFIRLHGWDGLQRSIIARFSVRRLYSRLLLSHQARKLYRSSTSNHSKSNDNDHADELE